MAADATPATSVAAGFLDWVVEPDELQARALEHAHGLVGLDMEAHRRSKQRVRADDLRAIRRGLTADLRELTLMGARRLLRSRSR